MLISILIVFLIFILFSYLIIKSYKDIQIRQHKIIFTFIRISLNLCKSIFYIPFLEIYFTVIVCDKNYFDENIECWKSEHLVYCVLCFISVLMISFLSFIITRVSYSNKEKFSSSVSKYLIINADLILLISRTFVVVLLELCVVIETINITIIFLFLSSLLCAYWVSIERKYQNIKVNNLINIKYVFNIFFFVNCTILLIGNLIKNKTFLGIFYVFIILSIVFIIFVYSFSLQFNILNRPIKTDTEIYNNIRIIIELVENKNKNRQNLLKLLSYSFYLTHGEQLTKIKNMTPLKKIVELYNNELKENESTKFEFYFYQYIEGLYKDALKIFRDSPLLLINYSIFQLEKMHRYHKAYRILLKCLILTNINYAEEFFIYRIKRKLEEKGNELGKDYSNISYTYQINNMISLISEVSYSYSQLYGLLLNNTKIMDINHLKEIAIKIDNLNMKIHEGYKKIEKSGFNSKKISLFYDNFVKDILHDSSKTSKYFNDDEGEEGIKLDSYFFNVNSITSKSNFQFLIASGNIQNFGTIIKISLELCELLGYSDKDMIGQNMNIFLPNILRIPHENFLREKIHNSPPIDEYSIHNLKTIPVCFRTSSKFLIPTNLEVGIFYDENNQPIIFGKLLKLDMNYYKKCVVIINYNLIIQIFSSNSIYLLGLDSSIMNNNVEISTFFQEYYSDCLNYFSSHNNENKDILQIKIKLLKEHFFSDKETIITWKNHKKFKVQWNELKIGKKLYGYSIFFEPLDLFMLEKNYVDSIYSPIHRKKTHKKMNINDCFPAITKNFLPESEKKINFDMKTKTYVIKDIEDYENDKNNIEKRESIKEYFENKVKSSFHKSDQKKFEDKSLISSNFNSEISSGFENESIEYSSSFEEEEEEEKKEEKEKIKSKHTLKEIIIENPEDKYYQVKLKKVFLKIYDFKNHIIKDCNDYIVQSKMSKIINVEQELTKKKLIKKNPEKIEDNVISKSDNLKFSIIHSKQTLLEDEHLLNRIAEKIIKKIITPKLININILYYLFFYLFQLISLVLVSSFLFITVIKHIKEIYTIYLLIYNQCNLINNVGVIRYYTFEYVILKNPHYYNFFQSNRTKYRESIYVILQQLYTKSMDEINYLDYNHESFSKSEKNKLKNLSVIIDIYYKTYGDENAFNQIYLGPDNALKEYIFSLFKFLISEDTEIHFLNINFIFMQSNSIKLSEIMLRKTKIYMEIINSLIKHIKFIVYLIFGFFFIVSIIVSTLTLLIKIKIIKEKEKYLGMFYKIDPEIVKIMFLKCEKYSKIQINKDNPINDNNILDIGNEDEIDSLIDTTENDYNNSFKDKFHNESIRKKNIKQGNIFNNMEFKKAIIFEIVFILILSIILIILICIVNNSYKYYQIYADLNFIIIFEETMLFIAINLIKIGIVESGNFSSYEKYQNYVNLIPEMTKNYSKIKEIEDKIHSTVIQYNLPGNSSNILYSYATNNLCNFLQNFSIENNISCTDFAYNISNFGLSTIHSFYFNSLIESGFICINLAEKAILEGNLYYDKYYGTSNYVDIYDNEDYAKNNPFSAINFDGLRDSNVIFSKLLNPLTNYLIFIIFQNITQYDEDLKILIVIIMIIFYAVVLLTYFIFIFPFIFKENKDLNKTKIILGVIPKIVLYEIIKTEYLNEPENVK